MIPSFSLEDVEGNTYIYLRSNHLPTHHIPHTTYNTPHKYTSRRQKSNTVHTKKTLPPPENRSRTKKERPTNTRYAPFITHRKHTSIQHQTSNVHDKCSSSLIMTRMIKTKKQRTKKTKKTLPFLGDVRNRCAQLICTKKKKKHELQNACF